MMRPDVPPQKICCRVAVAVDQMNHHDSGKQYGAAIDVRQKTHKPFKHTEQHQNLQNKQHQNQTKPAEYGSNQAFLALFQ